MAFLRLMIVFLFVGMVSGCAATQQKTSINQLQFQVSELERQLAEKDDEISELRDELSNVSSDMRRQQRITTEEVRAVSGSKKEYGDIIRVDASAGQVQIALKKAGYYSGAIDSKIGNNTKKAIAQFQQDNGLKSDGVVGRKTWEKLSTYLE